MSHTLHLLELSISRQHLLMLRADVSAPSFMADDQMFRRSLNTLRAPSVSCASTRFARTLPS